MPGFDVIGVFDSRGNEVFTGARSVRALVKPQADFMKHPAENGVTFTDHIVFRPDTIELSVILDPATVADTYGEIKNIYRSVAPLTVVTIADVYENMFIDAIPYDQVPEMVDTIAIGLKFEQAIIVAAQYSQLPATAVKKKSNASTVKAGQKNAKPANSGQTSSAYALIFGSGG